MSFFNKKPTTWLLYTGRRRRSLHPIRTGWMDSIQHLSSSILPSAGQFNVSVGFAVDQSHRSIWIPIKIQNWQSVWGMRHKPMYLSYSGCHRWLGRKWNSTSAPTIVSTDPLNLARGIALDKCPIPITVIKIATFHYIRSKTETAIRNIWTSAGWNCHRIQGLLLRNHSYLTRKLGFHV